MVIQLLPVREGLKNLPRLSSTVPSIQDNDAVDQYTLGLDPLPRKTRKEVVLEEMNQAVPWALGRAPSPRWPPSISH